MDFSVVNGAFAYPSVEIRKNFYRRTGGSIGLDGSLLMEGEFVYVLPWSSYGMKGPIVQIDYFHGWQRHRAVAVTYEDEDGSDDEVHDIDMINAAIGFTATRVCHLQKRYRAIQSRKVRLTLALSLLRLLPHTVGGHIAQFLCKKD